jgi:hypothetical protein
MDGDFWVSVEEVTGQPTVTAAGILKRLKEPVLVALGATRTGTVFAASILFAHSGLQPGPYELVTAAGERLTVVIPPGLSQEGHRLITNAQLEIFDA